MIKVKVRVRIKTSPSLVVAFAVKSLNETANDKSKSAVKSLNETVRVLKPKAQEAKTFGTYE